jgi:hypothetical protein
MPFELQPQIYIHGSKLAHKAASVEALRPLLETYQRWKERSLAVQDRSDDSIRLLTEYLNDYKNVVEPVFDARPNSAQEVLQPSILEEFFEYLFCRLDTELKHAVLRRPDSGFIDLAFNPRSLRELVTVPDYTIKRKDHDFVIGASLQIEMTVVGSDERQTDVIVIPAVAIECKRYLERNMLDECSGTAERVKKATPYCLYFVVAEFLKMDDAAPELSRIDEIYILRKQRNSERNATGFVPRPIDAVLVIDIYRQVLRHLSRVWWDPQSVVTTGKAFNFPR